MTVTKNERVARVLGRDHSAIKTVIDSIQQKPNFSSLVSYSINCLGNMSQNKHNLDSVVECGGIPTVIAMMKRHKDNEGIPGLFTLHFHGLVLQCHCFLSYHV